MDETQEQEHYIINWLRNYWLPVLVTSIVTIIIIVAALGYIYSWKSIGMIIYEYAPNGNPSKIKEIKTFWDWLDLLVLPVLFALGGYWFTSTQKKNEQGIAQKKWEKANDIALEERRQNKLERYFDKMTELILKSQLSNKSKSDNVIDNNASSIAKARTLDVLRQLDDERMRQVLEFLHDVQLINKETRNIHILKHANLRDAKLQEIELENVNFGNVDLTNAELGGARLSGGNLNNAKLIRAKLIATDLRDANLSQAKLNGANCFGAKMDNADLTKASFDKYSKLNAVSLVDAKLNGVDMRETDLTGETDLTRAELKEARLERANFIGAIMNDTHFEGAYLNHAILTNTHLSGAFFNDAILNDATLIKSAMDDAILTRAKLRYADLSDADLRYADLRETDLNGAVFSQADLGYANLKDAKTHSDDQLLAAKNLKGAIMPDGQLYEDWIKGKSALTS